MRCRVVRRLLGDYVDVRLVDARRRAVETHLARCADCRAEAAAQRALLGAVKRLPHAVEPPENLWDNVAARLGPRSEASPAVPPPAAAWGFESERAHRFGLAAPVGAWGIRPALAAALVLAVGAAAWLPLRAHQGWRVRSTVGNPSISPEVLATDHRSRIRLAVGRIGEVEVAPDSRVHLLAATLREHRLALDRGAIEARISAPPRLFYVETPSATAVDLGCAYTLAVDANGGSLLHVTVGWVELSWLGSSSVVPFNMSAYTRPGFVPGTPFSDRAADSLKVALIRFDFEQGGAAALATVLAHATERDAITLWHLLARSDGTARADVYRKLALLAPPPAGVTEAGVLRLDGKQLQRWWDALPGSPGTPTWFERLAARLAVWTGAL
jgi:anti-sigma-K factor RskA